MTEEKRRFIKKARPALIAFRVAHFPKASKKNICLFGFAKWYYRKN